MPNIELLKKTLMHIKDHPETWDQGEWCGTTQCFAGWAVTLAGVELGTRPGFDPILVFIDDLPEDLAAMVDPDVEWITIREAAVLALGIANAKLIDDEPDGLDEPESAASVLFYSGNTLDDLERFVADLCGETAEAGVR